VFTDISFLRFRAVYQNLSDQVETITPQCPSNVRFHFTPTYSSWLKQVEIWFSRIQRDVIARGVFTSVIDLARKLRRHIQAYSTQAKPIRWKYNNPSSHIGNVLFATRH
jgi:transposase